jgi:predicted RNA binding protein YcfA (HicA-like mRNA interferase family)
VPPRHVILELVPLKVRDVLKVLERHGWRHIRTTGDHRIYRSSDGRVTVVSGKPGNDVRPGTWRAILRQTGIEEPEK